ncbi:RICIN domain-containing protein [Paenibacillus sp. sptzw28]|nr:RICIN domain-containing protein [Paenibacillus sp. sptzw28]
MYKKVRTMRKSVIWLLCCLLVCSLYIPVKHATAATARQMEALDRGVVAVSVSGGVFISWRMLGTDPDSVSFNLYRNGTKVNASPISTSTNYLDAQGTASSLYNVRAIVNSQEQPASETGSVWGQNYYSLPLQVPPGGTVPDGSYTYNANDASVGDLDGDGDYEIVVKWDPSNSKDNSQFGYSGPAILDAYRLDGTRLWRINLGRNIRAGAHYTQFLVYDFDGDGKAEVVCKTADGTVDGKGVTIGNASADYRNSDGFILSGPEYLTVFSGITGEALSTVSYDPPRGTVSSWGDSYGNRVDRFLAAVAYLDGQRPSIVMARGYYTRTVLAAYNWRDGQLTKLWTFDSNSSGNSGYAGQGNHNLSVGDVDNDSKDEILYGSMAVDDSGSGLYSTGLGHGDAMHFGDLDPDRPGLEVFKVNEEKAAQYGAEIHNAASGQVYWGVFTGVDTGRGMAADVDPRYKGEELWASNGVGLNTVKGQKIGSTIPSSINFGIWWDGDLLRELLDHTGSGGNGTISKWNYQLQQTDRLLTATGTASNNTTKGNPSLQADILGDWREEAVWRTADSSALRIYTTTEVTNHRIRTLMHDPIYRLGIAWQNVGYNQPPHTGFYLGDGMSTPPKPDLYPAGIQGTFKLLNTSSGKALDVYAGVTADGTNVQIWTDNGGDNQLWNIVPIGEGSYKLINVRSGKALDVDAGGTANGTNVQIWTDNGSAGQRWKIVANPDGSHRLISSLSGKALDVYAKGTADGTNVQIWTDNGGDNQKWRLVKP